MPLLCLHKQKQQISHLRNPGLGILWLLYMHGYNVLTSGQGGAVESTGGPHAAPKARSA